jgi:hypothetical protein
MPLDWAHIISPQTKQCKGTVDCPPKGDSRENRELKDMVCRPKRLVITRIWKHQKRTTYILRQVAVLIEPSTRFHDAAVRMLQ